MKIRILTTIFLFALNFIAAQEIKIKNDKVLLDGNLFLKYEKINTTTHSVYDLNDNEIVFVKYLNKIPGTYDDHFFSIHFVTQKIKVESTDLSRIGSLSFKKSMQKLIQWLVKDKVINSDGSINQERLSIFFDKYDENITY